MANLFARPQSNGSIQPNGGRNLLTKTTVQQPKPQGNNIIGGLSANLFPGLADILNGGVSQYVKNFNDPNSQQNINRSIAMQPQNLVAGFGGGDLPELVSTTKGAVKSAASAMKGAKDIITPDQDPLALTSKITGATTPKAQLTDLATMQSLHDSGYLKDITDTPGLQKAIDKKISDNVKAVTEALKKAPNSDATLTAKDMAEHLKNTDTSTDYIKEALKNLQSHYKASLQDTKLNAVNKLLEKYKKEGLTASNINDLSRIYGTEFGSKSFTQAGVEKAGVTADKAEVVRSNLKSISRDMMPDEATRQIDQETSNLINTKVRIEKQAKSVLSAQSNTPASSPAQRGISNIGSKIEKGRELILGKPTSFGAKGTVGSTEMEALMPKHISLLTKLLLNSSK